MSEEKFIITTEDELNYFKNHPSEYSEEKENDGKVVKKVISLL